VVLQKEEEDEEGEEEEEEEEEEGGGRKKRTPLIEPKKCLEVTCSRNGKQLTCLRTCETAQICCLENCDSLLEQWSNWLEHPVKMGVSMIVCSAISICVYIVTSLS